jgi:hypothetical protein
MNRLRLWVPLVLLFVGLLWSAPVSLRAGADVLASTSDPHAYFNALAVRADLFKAYSLRDQAQLDELKASRTRRAWVTYDPAADTDAQRQDAAKVVVPDFDAFSQLARALTAGETTMQLTASNSLMTGALSNSRAVKIDQEIMIVSRQSGVPITDSTVTIQRGQHGTIAAAHTAGANVLLSVNSLINIPKLPLRTVDGHTYLFTWDAYWTESFLFGRTGISNYKTWQFTNNDSLWLQVDTRFTGMSGGSTNAGATGASIKTPSFNQTTDIGVAGARGYNVLGGPADWLLSNGNQSGPGVSYDSTLTPQVGTFVIYPRTWTRYWVQIEQRANDYDLMSMWVADETRDPVKLFDRLPLSVRPTGTRPNTIDYFWLEYNTSDNALKPGRGSMVAYMRNFVALQDAASPTALLVRPFAGTPLPPPTAGPAAPTNLRIVK